MNYMVSLVFDKRRECKKRPNAVGAQSSLKTRE